jgi:hypothetical protein
MMQFSVQRREDSELENTHVKKDGKLQTAVLEHVQSLSTTSTNARLVVTVWLDALHSISTTGASAS